MFARSTITNTPIFPLYPPIYPFLSTFENFVLAAAPDRGFTLYKIYLLLSHYYSSHFPTYLPIKFSILITTKPIICTSIILFIPSILPLYYYTCIVIGSLRLGASYVFMMYLPFFFYIFLLLFFI